MWLVGWHACWRVLFGVFVSRTHGAHSFVFIHSQKRSNFYRRMRNNTQLYIDIPHLISSNHVHLLLPLIAAAAAAKTVSCKCYANRSKQHFQIRRLQFLNDRTNVRMWRLVLSSNYRHQCQLNKFGVRVFFEHWREKTTLSQFWNQLTSNNPANNNTSSSSSSKSRKNWGFPTQWVLDRQKQTKIGLKQEFVVNFVSTWKIWSFNWIAAARLWCEWQSRTLTFFLRINRLWNKISGWKLK